MPNINALPLANQKIRGIWTFCHVDFPTRRVTFGPNPIASWGRREVERSTSAFRLQGPIVIITQYPKKCQVKITTRLK